MLLIGIYMVFVLLVAAAVVWLYRNLFVRRGLRQDLVGRADTHTQMTLKAQQGFITLGARERQRTAGDPRRYARAGEIRVPWGW